MSSRSLAAARARRAGENAPPVSGNRPGTSIGSSAAFSQQMPPPPNVRLARAQQQAYPQSQQAYQPSQAYPQSQQPYQPSQAYQQVQQSQQQSQNGLPFTKLSISDAIGLITMRLGRCEQWIIETEHENEENGGTTSVSGLPENSRIIDNSILTNFVNRLDSLEKREPGSNIDTDAVSKLSGEVAQLNEQLARIVEEASKHSLITAKHTEQLFKFERELVETKDILKTFMLKYDTFTGETTEKLGDFEFAISEIEKNLPVIQENVVEENVGEETANDETATADLKSLVQQELADVDM
jgi:hypothetical protein